MNKKVTFEDTIERLDKLPPPERMSKSDKEVYTGVGLALLRNESQLLIENKQWVLGVIMMATMLDFVGKTKLIWKHKGAISSREINRYKAYKTNRQLLDLEIIDGRTYKEIERIRKARNEIAHDLIKQFSLSHTPNPKLERLIREGLKIIETLF